MLQHELEFNKSSRKSRKRVGRGNASGHGTFSGRGCKGQNARAGGNVRPGFEGGQTPLYKRLPKLKGFKNNNKIEYQVINLWQLSDLLATDITPELLYEFNLISKINVPVKILAGGEINKAIDIKAHKISVVAKAKIEKMGGKVHLL